MYIRCHLLLDTDVVDLIGDHLDLFRRNQTAIGVDVMGTLSSEERDERLKHNLLVSKELHPALMSPESEYKVLQRLMGGMLAIILRPREAQCPLVRCIARELLTCLVMQPIMNFASPGYINELIEYIFLANKDEGVKDDGNDKTYDVQGHNHDSTVTAISAKSNESATRKNASSHKQGAAMTLSLIEDPIEPSSSVSGNSLSRTIQDESLQPRPADWARVLEAATQRRTEVLMPENLENMWAIGRNYKKKLQKNAERQTTVAKSLVNSAKDSSKETQNQKLDASIKMEERSLMQLPPRPHPENQTIDGGDNALNVFQEMNQEVFSKEDIHGLEDATIVVSETKNRLRRSSSTSDLRVELKREDVFASQSSGSIISEFYSADFSRHNDVQGIKSASAIVLRNEGHNVSKLRCRVLGAYFEKLGSKSFAVYSIAVTDANNQTCFVKRRYSNFERLHRHLKDIPNYTLHLPPKRIFSSSTEDAFVHQRCIQLDKYLRDLLSIANVAEQHEVLDFLSASSKNYSFGKSSSVMRSLAVNVDDAVDDIVRQFKGVSDGLMRKVVGSPSSLLETASSVPSTSLSWNADDINRLALKQSTPESVNSLSDNEEHDKDGSRRKEETVYTEQANGWHSDNELNSKGFPPRVIKSQGEFESADFDKKHASEMQSESVSSGGYTEASLAMIPCRTDDPTGMPPEEWTPPNLSVPVLNLVDKIFQLKRRGWLRRQVFWISKQILQLMMEDAIDDWLLRQIHWLRREDVIAQGIHWVQDVLWPDGTFFLKLKNQSEMDDCQSNQSRQTTRQNTGSRGSKSDSFEQQLEAARRANDVKKMIFDGAPATLVSLIGHKQYRRCARDLYYFLQSTVCLKQLAYGVLELLLISVFPELRDLVMDIHEKMGVPHA